MKLIIGKKIKPERKPPYFRVTIDFMRGDSDGEDSEVVYFGDDEESVEKLKLLILILLCCNAAYPNGKGEYEDYHGLPEYDAVFCDEELTEKDFRTAEDFLLYTEYNDLFGEYINHPYYNDGHVTSFDGFVIEYINENVDRTEINFKDLTKEEKLRITYAEKFFAE